MPIKVIQWDLDAWEDYLYWQSQDKKNLKKMMQTVRATFTVRTRLVLSRMTRAMALTIISICTSQTSRRRSSLITT